MERGREGRRGGAGGGAVSAPRRPRTIGFKDASGLGWFKPCRLTNNLALTISEVVNSFVDSQHLWLKYKGLRQFTAMIGQAPSFESVYRTSCSGEVSPVFFRSSCVFFFFRLMQKIVQNLPGSGIGMCWIHSNFVSFDLKSPQNDLLYLSWTIRGLPWRDVVCGVRIVMER